MNQPSSPSKNPLTIIAIFAGIIEASALASLPFLDNDSQNIYTWFLVGFPPFLTALFFLTLNFNSKSLYSPSDFVNEEDFLKLRESSANHEKSETISDNITPSESSNPSIPTAPRTPTRKKKPTKSDLSKAPSSTSADDNTSGHLTVHLKSSFRTLHIIDSRVLTKKISLPDIFLAATPDGCNNNPETTELLAILLTNTKTEPCIDAFLIDALRSENKKNAPSRTVAIYNLDTLTLTTLIRQNPDNNRHPP
ncbi:hypothetical protein NVV94_21025 [Pseudomonas sp. LS1212]|uniref:hypothetical protein n=1 Tax=Pseudomonas sp. LS1212 TaxID=2972478 RepID=UPI00215BACB1|nr:hypothetical protein [Pseudomonas sp. LS1212]UVJ43040.1 hypothetical protein NVV94_21025 [Pseudomonas sp. LS1212]